MTSAVAAIGVDVGSTTWKAVAIDRAGQVLARKVEAAHPRIEEQTARLLSELEKALGCSSVPLGATGYGRKRVKAARSLTEITCHAKGAWKLAAKPGVLVDMGGQDTKVIRIGAGGEVRDFAMNDKCAAGTGRFLEVILARLHVPFEEVRPLVAKAAKPVAVSSTCTVFAESEVISLVAQGEPVEGIVAGMLQSLARRVSALAGALPDGPVLMSGGVARNEAMVEALGKALGRTVEVLPEPQTVGALGAALSTLA